MAKKMGMAKKNNKDRLIWANLKITLKMDVVYWLLIMASLIKVIL
jgi:hypothetical protein